jgi:hypothetical protein
MKNAAIKTSHWSHYKWKCYSRLKWEAPQNVQLAWVPLFVLRRCMILPRPWSLQLGNGEYRRRDFCAHEILAELSKSTEDVSHDKEVSLDDSDDDFT